MTKHFYAVDHVDGNQAIHAFTVKTARDNFVNGGNRRFAKTAKETDVLCNKAYDCTALESVDRGFI